MASIPGTDDATRIVGIESESVEWVEKVIELGDKHRNRLGPMPFSGFREAALTSNIVLAITAHEDRSETLAGYCLYAPTVRSDRYARIAHLCVADDSREKGIAGRLVDAVMIRCSDRLGLRLRCRDDWEAADVWPLLGFEPVLHRVGRGKTREPMTEWYRPNDTANLFSIPSEDSDQLLVAIDSNVFCDLFGTSPTRRQRFSGTVALLAASEEIRLARPFSLTTELNKTSDQRERDALLQTAAIGGLKVLTGDRTLVRKLRDELLGEVPADVLKKDLSLKMDATLVAESILGLAEVFVTRDAAIVTHLGPTAAERHHVAVLYPDELPTFIDRRADAASYFPVQLEQTQYQLTRGDAAIWNPERLLDLLSNETGERKVDFRARIRTVAADAGSGERQIMLTPAGEVLAIWATKARSPAFDVPLLRVQRGPLLPTIVRQISRQLRRAAAEALLTSVEVTDPNVSSAVAIELQRDGFSTADSSGSLIATVLTTVGNWDQVLSAARDVAPGNVLLPPSLSSAAEASEYERALWPAKILHPDLATYIVPIRGVFADELLGHLPTLLARTADLGLSREHVYYRSGRSRPPAPGRILWYSSARDRQIVACSRLVESVTGTPEVLHREFANIGVLSLEQVRSVRDARGKVNAMRFADTEIFAHPLPLTRVKELSNVAAKLTIQSPVQVDSDTFERLYKEAVSR